MKRFFRRLYYKMFPTYVRVELRLVNRFMFDKLMMSTITDPEGWVWAEEENKNNYDYWVVYLERRKRVIE